MQLELDEVPSKEELKTAMQRLKLGRAGSKNGIMPDLVAFAIGGEELQERLLQVISDVWGQQVVSDWRDAEVVPIPKKGDLHDCDNWRGISLSDIVGKVFARILQERLQKVVEDMLLDSPCGFRKGQGCVDMIFVARQIAEKTREHNMTLNILFVDLRKAYNSVPQLAIWKVLEK